MLTNPAYLFALAGLALPIAIHLLSRKEGKVIKLGSVRHVLETSTQQFKGIKLNEIVLLMLRCTMILVFCLLLSGLQCTSTGKEKWIIVERGLEKNPMVQHTLDSAGKNEFELHWLANGFPKTNDSVATVVSYRSLLEQLQHANLERAIVFSKNSSYQFAGLRTSLPGNITWISEPQDSTQFIWRSIRTAKDSALIITGHSSSNETRFSSKTINFSESKIPVAAIDSVRVFIAAESQFVYDKKIITAALSAIEKTVPVRFAIREGDAAKIPTNTGWCFWLSQKEIPTTSINIIALRPRIGDELLVKTSAKTWQLSQNLNETVALEGSLVLKLAKLVVSSSDTTRVVRLNDRRMIPDSLAWSHGAEKSTERGVTFARADSWLIALLIGLLFVERVIAYRRNQ